MHSTNRYKESSYDIVYNETSNNNSQAISSSQYKASNKHISNESLAIFILFVTGIIIIACGLIIYSLKQAKISSTSVCDKDIQMGSESASLEMGLVNIAWNYCIQNQLPIEIIILPSIFD